MESFKFNPDKHHRKSIRLTGFNYSTTRHYFVTICCNFREPLLGHIQHENSVLNQAGLMVDSFWMHLPHKFPSIKLYAHIVMPDHIHGIIEIVSTDEYLGAPLHAIVQWFKTMTTNAYIKNVHTNNWPAFSGKLWQRNYYEHIIRDEKSLAAIMQYIHDNPKNWLQDEHSYNT
jgi:putative transposase